MSPITAPMKRSRSRSLGYSTANNAAASISRSRYCSLLTSTATPSSLPPVNGNGLAYWRLTVSELSKPTHRPSPQSVNLPIWVR